MKRGQCPATRRWTRLLPVIVRTPPAFEIGVLVRSSPEMTLSFGAPETLVRRGSGGADRPDLLPVDRLATEPGTQVDAHHRFCFHLGPLKTNERHHHSSSRKS
jgi:hypothetical protein